MVAGLESENRVLRPVYSHSLTVTRRPAAGTAEAQGWGGTYALALISDD